MIFLHSFERFLCILEEPDGRKEQDQEVGTEISLLLWATGPGPQVLPLPRSCQFGGEKCSVSQTAAAAAESGSLPVFPGGFKAGQPLTLGDDVSTPRSITPG